MHEFSQQDLTYVTRADEVLWGALLLALTFAIHGTGMLLTLRATNSVRDRIREVQSRLPAVDLGIVILGVWIIVFVNLIEVATWAAFFVLKGAQPNISTAFYNAMLNYTTLQAGYLPLRWRLLEGMLGMSGLLTLAWSTSILFILAEEFMEQVQKDQKKRQSRSAPAPHHGSGDSG
jgi:hypothetical protein